MALSGAGTLSVEDCTASIIHSASYFAVIATTADALTSLIRLAYASALFQYRLATSPSHHSYSQRHKWMAQCICLLTKHNNGVFRAGHRDIEQAAPLLDRDFTGAN